MLDMLCARGASFVHEIAASCRLNDEEVRVGLGELVAAGVVASDGFGGLRAMVRAATARPDRNARSAVAGRWSVLPTGGAGSPAAREAAVEVQALSLLCRYGVVFRRLLTREANAAPWRELTRVYRRLEARGEIRGGRFVSGMSGEQFALGDAIEQLREIRRTAPNGQFMTISTADPLNLAGIVTTGDRVRAVAGNRIVYRDGVPLAALEGDYMRPLCDLPAAVASDVATSLTGRARPPVLSGFVGR